MFRIELSSQPQVKSLRLFAFHRGILPSTLYYYPIKLLVLPSHGAKCFTLLCGLSGRALRSRDFPQAESRHLSRRFPISNNFYQVLVSPIIVQIITLFFHDYSVSSGLALPNRANRHKVGELISDYIFIRLGLAKVQGDRKALPVKAQWQHCQICCAEGRINGFYRIIVYDILTRLPQHFSAAALFRCKNSNTVLCGCSA